MARPKKVTTDPAWIVRRNREDRHRDKTQVSIRVAPAMRERWHQAAAREGRTLKEWVILHLEAAAVSQLEAAES